MKMELMWAIFYFFGAVIILGNCLDWMAGGTFTQADFATLRAKVDNFVTQTLKNQPVSLAKPLRILIIFLSTSNTPLNSKKVLI